MAEILNKTAMVTEFILVGFTHIRWLQILLFWVILLTYLLTITGNLLIIYITLVDHRLHTPMYFFLRNFSVLEIGFTSSAIPKALFNLASGNNTISLAGCFSQAFFYFILGTAEFFILSTMSFDRYVAICNPLRYTVIMNSQLCTQLVLGSWIISFLYVIMPLILLFHLPFCGPNIINHFFCDNMPLIKLACTNTQFLELMDFLMATFTVLGTLAITIISYIKIIAAVMHIPSRTGRQKKGFLHLCFSHCGSFHHLRELHFHVCQAHAKWWAGPQQDGRCSEQCGFSFAQPLHLQPEKQAGENSFEGYLWMEMSIF